MEPLTAKTADERDWTLTRAGWPRPVVAGWPVPWVAPAEHLAETDTTRRDASASGAICQVCGGDYGTTDTAYGFASFGLNSEPATDTIPLEFGAYIDELPGVSPDDLLTVLDGAIMHWRCAKLSSAMCPHIRDRTDLVCVAVPANQGMVKAIDGVLRPHYAAQYVRCAPWPARSPHPYPEEGP